MRRMKYKELPKSWKDNVIGYEELSQEMKDILKVKYKEYIEYVSNALDNYFLNGVIPKTYAKLISEKLGYEYVCKAGLYGYEGNCNQSMFNNFFYHTEVLCFILCLFGKQFEFGNIHRRRSRNNFSSNCLHIHCFINHTTCEMFDHMFFAWI